LALLVARLNTNDAQNAITLDDFTVAANPLD